MPYACTMDGSQQDYQTIASAELSLQWNMHYCYVCSLRMSIDIGFEVGEEGVCEGRSMFSILKAA